MGLYTVYMHGSYMNTFNNYTDACELRDYLSKKFNTRDIIIKYNRGE